MSELLSVRASFLDTGSSLNAQDVEFYRSIPNVSIQTSDPDTGGPAIPLPASHQKAIRVVMAAMLSSTVLAQAIKSYLDVQPTRIEISIKKSNQTETVVFEGPSIKESESEIEKILTKMTAGEQKPHVDILAKRKPGDSPKPR